MDKYPLPGSPIEYFLSQFLVVALCAEMEERLDECVKERGRDGSDSRLAQYVSSTAKASRRGVKKKEISALLGLFGSDVKEAFNCRMDDAQVTKYNNLVAARHYAAHGEGSNVTLGEVREVLEIADEILRVAHEALRQPIEE